MSVAYDIFASRNIGFGGASGRLSPDCPDGYSAIGRLCIKFPIQAASPNDEMDNICKQSFGDRSVPYSPVDQIQNAVFQVFLRSKIVSTQF